MADPGDVAAGTIETLHQAKTDCVAGAREYDRNGRSRLLGRKRRWRSASRQYQRYVARYEFGRQCGKPVIMTVRPSIFDRDAFADDKARVGQPLMETRQDGLRFLE